MKRSIFLGIFCVVVIVAHASVNAHQDTGEIVLEAQDVALVIQHDGVLVDRISTGPLCVGDNETKALSKLWYAIDQLPLPDRQDPLYAKELFAIEEILKTRCDVNEKNWVPFPDNFLECTPLHVAVFRQDIKLLALLLKYGADKTILDGNYATPLDYAKARRHREIMMLLGATPGELKEAFPDERKDDMTQSDPAKPSSAAQKDVVSTGDAQKHDKRICGRKDCQSACVIL